MRRDRTGQTRTGDEERRGFSYLQLAVSMTKTQPSSANLCLDKAIVHVRQMPTQRPSLRRLMVPWVGCVGWIFRLYTALSLDG
jgi:hypothetical protein